MYYKYIKVYNNDAFLLTNISISIYFDLILDLLSLIMSPAELKFLSDSTEEPGMQKYFNANSCIGLSSQLLT